MKPVLITPPASGIVALSDVTDDRRIDPDMDNLRITALIAAAGSYLDGWSGILGRCILPQTWAIRQDSLCDSRLPFPDVRSAVVKYFDASGAEQVLDPGAFRLVNDGLSSFLQIVAGFAPPAVADRPDAVRIEAEFGMDAVPPAIRQAAILLIGHWYENREAAVLGVSAATVPLAVEALLAPWRMVSF
jgi:uncharacterized phiE125 gp8 family phage protein